MLVKFFDFFMKNLLTPISFLIILIVQLKIIGLLRSTTELVMFYGKQVEELRKMGAGAAPRRVPDVPPDETGLYEVLKD